MSKNPNSNIPWWTIVLGFLLCWPIGLVLLFLSLGGVRLPSSSTRRLPHSQNKTYSPVQNISNENIPSPSAGSEEGIPRPEGAHVVTVPPSRSRKLPREVPQPQRFFKRPRSGKAMTVFGGIITFLFAVILLPSDLSKAFQDGFLETMGNWFSSFGCLCAGLFLLCRGISTGRLSRRAILYQNMIGQKSSIYLSDLATTSGVNEKQLLSDLQRMLDSGALPSGYIDRASGRLVLLDLNPVPEEVKPPKPAPRKDIPHETGDKSDPDSVLLRQIQEVNDAIPDPIMSAKINRIEEITRKILAYQKNNPEKSEQLRQFLNYYLPTTLKILNAYAQMDAQGVEGKNISTAKHRIENMMDKVVEGFEKQLDQLFQSEAMDITADVEVLERMLDRDGLGFDSMTMGEF